MVGIDRKEVIEKAKKAKEQGGVGRKECGLSNLRSDNLYKTLDKNRRLLEIINNLK